MAYGPVSIGGYASLAPASDTQLGGIKTSDNFSISPDGVLKLSDEIFDSITRGGVVASGSNYVRFTDGTQICWEIGCYVDGYITETNRRVNFPVAFASTPAVVAASNANIGNTTVIVGWESTTGFTIGETSGNLRGNTNWIAIGRWK